MTEQVEQPARRRAGIPEATVARLPLYLRALHALAEQGRTTVSSQALADGGGVNSAKVRKDLSHLGSYGTRGVGYEVEYLVYQISRELGLTQQLAGRARRRRQPRPRAGRLRRLRLPRLPHRGAARRRPRAASARSSAACAVRHVDELEEVVARAAASRIGVIATPAAAAQEVCDRLVAAGVTSILNFAPAVLSVPDGVDLRKVDLVARAADPVLPRAPQGRQPGEVSA